MQKLSAIFAKLVIAIIRIYRYLLSPLLGNRCRFYPSCSQYMIIAIQQFGVLRGTWLGGKRLAKCHPFHPGGVDYVPGTDHND